MFFISFEMFGDSLAWTKTAGGDAVTWVGFELLHRSTQLGISQSRADLSSHWSREMANSEFIGLAAFAAGLGRIVYVAGALEFEHPFLGPLYRFLSLSSPTLIDSQSASLR